MAQRQFRSDDTATWNYGFGSGADGNYSSGGNATDAPIDASCSGTSGATSLSATNASFTGGQLILIHQTRGTGAGGWELNKIQSYVAGTITLSHTLTMTFTDSGASQAQVLVLKQYNNFTQGSGHTLTAKAWDGNVGGIIAFFAKGDTTITGALSSSGKGFIAAPANTTADQDGYQGEGTSGAGGTRSLSKNGNGAGGGDGGSGLDWSSGGGGGGNGAAGTNGQAGQQAAGGIGGDAVGNAGLTSMQLGGGGSSGGGGRNGFTNAAAGGIGGGLVLIITKDLSISGTIVTTGNNGVSDTNARNSGGGGGAGGSVLLKCATATLGTTKITSAGGSGGTGSGGAGYYNNGGAGAVGRIHLDYSGSYSGSTSPTIDARNDTSIIDAVNSSFILMF